MSQIKLNGLHKQFGTAPILSDVNLTVEPGEFCVFIGPSGCGKSTLLRIVAGLEEQSAGDVWIDGRCVNTFAPAQRDIAMVFQSYALYPHMSVYENMAFGLRHLRLPKDEIDRRVRLASESLRLGELLERKPGALSGGQRQRVAIGRAIVRKPKVFLFDEPLSNLDAALRVKTRVEIAKLHRSLDSTSMIYVTHDQVEAMTLADKIVLLRPLEGRSGIPSIAQIGTPLDLYHRPASQFVAGFIGSPAMNFLPASVAAASRTEVRALARNYPLDASVSGDSLEAGTGVTLGIRPEHVRVGTGAVTGQVAHVEQMGEHTYLYLDTPLCGQPIVAKTDAGGARIGDRLRVDLPAGALHLFHPDGRAAARTPREPAAPALAIA
ncbi:TPA: sn-glycerol-3-phosphate ABC transporter ATP-binding protein UgpC [Burkholderia aenigmatica]|uniref:ABC transporter ATP-binding protein n=1 Tax=Burkholderia TaxID=32008 RepID=UPI0004D610BA|nr:sn-glycerol-3-phosphate ABC transporter ATP-binding protein UgpC [Burkholderia sp. AU45251]KER74190.1 ABC transporter [Burkholderia cepacia]HDR9484056.1 sn-glycerol-3-phosphate ABC transporter ATP-binding protein UgpC [Burkholderia aenigmatica]MDN7516317.1 sn-glycerol-3-phosphate ABC transporter ATP-binding protein UgpC [Burkholderia sp. AU45251]HDR9515021.1 sn-glycerol-3-phosphate ABC transporter ATP-binding protein UgpC [Burkholderia aenigmatica]HDR9592106.1 sn-glycerol-3-phosphate ABC tr